VAFVQGTASLGSVPTTRISVGNRQVGDPASGGCVDDTSSPTEITKVDRIQVVINRDAKFNAVFFTRNWLLTSRAILPYERANPK
jgi:hypothetical protein